MNNSEVLAKINLLRYLSIWVAISTSILIFVLAFLLTNKISLPLMRLTTSVKKSDHSELLLDFDDDLISRTDEIGLLAKAFKEKSEKVPIKIDFSNLSLFKI